MAYKGHKVAVVVPCYNEEASVAEVVRSMPDFVDVVISVDDGSTDKTWEVVNSLNDRRVTPLRHEKRSGVGSAIVSGHRKAMELGMDLSVVMAGDGQMDPAYLPKLLDAVIDEGYDYSKGNRYLRPGHLEGMPKYRVAGNFVLTFMTKVASGYWNVFDPQNGYTCIRTEVLDQLDLDHLTKGYNFENDMLVHLNVISAAVKDVPCKIRYDGHRSRIKPMRFLARSIGFLLQRFLYRVYKKYVLYDFGPYPLLFFPGAALFLMGLAFGVDILYLRYLAPVRFTASTGTLLLAVVGFVVGLQLLLTAFIFDSFQVPGPTNPPRRKQGEQDS